MSEHTPTPGPWTALFHHPQRMGGREYVMITAGAIVPLAAVVLGAEGCSQDEGRANARVIAALPDLVKALEAAETAYKALIGRAGYQAYQALEDIATKLRREALAKVASCPKK